MSEFEKAMMRILSVILVGLLVILYLRLSQMPFIHTDNLSKRHSSPNTETPAIIYCILYTYT